MRRGEVAQAGPLDEAGIDPGRSVVPSGAEAECDVTLVPFAGGIDVDGTVSAPWAGVCRRCAEPVSGELRIHVHERYADGPLSGPSDEEIYPIDDDVVDLGPLVRDAIVLELPMAPLCTQDCAGLCPSAGRTSTRAPAGALPRVIPGGLTSTCSGSRLPGTPALSGSTPNRSLETLHGCPEEEEVQGQGPQPSGGGVAARPPGPQRVPALPGVQDAARRLPQLRLVQGRQAVEVD